jgi:predicted dehydrogenase
MHSAKKKCSPEANNISRRCFLASAAGTAVGFTILPRYVLGNSGFTAPSEKVNIAVIGAGNQGMNDLRGLLQFPDVQIIAVCDVAEQAASDEGDKGIGRNPALRAIEKAYSARQQTKDYGKCAGFADFREMFDKMKNIDSVLIATPDHNHAIATMWAIKNKKHVYCEKPLTHDIYEARKITEAASVAGIVTQMGNQGHSGEGIRLTVEWIRDGVIGDIREVHSWSHFAGRYGMTTATRPKEQPPVPRGLDWNLWLGAKAYRPYHPTYHPALWRAWWEFGNSTIGDMACHNMDPAFWALDLNQPESVEASATAFNDETAPLGAIYYYQFGARGKMPPVKATWYSGGLLPPKPEELEEQRQLTGGGHGILFIGDKGKIMCDGWGGTPQIIPQSKMAEYKKPPRTIPRAGGDHLRNWIDACKNGTKACSDFSYSGPMTEAVLLGNVALRTGKKIYWDAKNMTATNAPEAEQFIHPAYHNGWTL